MRENLCAALAAIGKGWTFQDTNQEALPGHDLRRGWPTPTVLVNGHDLFGMPDPTVPSMGCRMYPGGVPSAAAFVERLTLTPSPSPSAYGVSPRGCIISVVPPAPPP